MTTTTSSSTTTGAASAPPNPLSGATVTAAAAIVAGLLILVRGQLPERNGVADYAPLAWVAVGLGLLAFILAIAGSYELPPVVSGQTDRWRFVRPLLGANGGAGRLAGGVGWIAAAVAAVVVATIALPELMTEWQSDTVFAVGLLVLAVLAVLGWGPAVTRSWPSGFRLSTLTFAGTVVALVLAAAYLYLLWLLFGRVNANDAEWARLVELRSTLEALAFAAVGALIGQGVARSAANSEIEQKDGIIAEQSEAIEVKDTVITEQETVIDEKDSKIVEALNLMTTPQLTIPRQLDEFNIDVVRADAGVTAAAPLRDARERLAEALIVGRED